MSISIWQTTISRIIIISATVFAGLWLIIETLQHFGIKPLENTGILGYLWLLLAALFGGMLITFLKFLNENFNIPPVSTLNISDDIVAIYKNKREAEPHIISSIDASSSIKIMAGRGSELQRETYAKIFELPQQFAKIKIMLPNPITQHGQIDWLDLREKEVISFDRAFAKNTLREQIKANINFVKTTATASQNFEFKLFNALHLGLIVITDNAVFFYFLKTNGHGRDSKMYQCKVDSEIYQWLNRYFDEIWKQSPNES